MRWIGLHLPLLSLEAFAATWAGLPEVADDSGGLPEALLALCDAHRITAANAAAIRQGVHAGLKRSTALALAPQLRLGKADAVRDRAALQAVAHAALGFTPSVALAPPDSVLLEVQASLRYFGGFDGLVGRLKRTLAPLGHSLWLASAPSAQGAALLARLQDGLHCPDFDALRGRLDAAPITLLGWRSGHGLPREQADALQRMGLRTLGDLRRLPRAGLVRRFGEALLVELDCALGQRPDPRPWLLLPAQFESRLELAARVDTTEPLLHAAGVLLARLLAWAAAQQARVRRFTLQMQHEPRHRQREAAPVATGLELALAEPSLDAAHLTVLLRERLGSLQLAAPTLELRLHCSDIVRQAAPNRELFPGAPGEGEGLGQLIERLQARLGAGQVQRLSLQADHRPERAGAVAAFAPASAARGDRVDLSTGLPVRPIWLLPQVQPLAERDARPLLDGRPLQLLSGPERIEAGWWDSALVERDYFIAQTAGGALVWVYRSRLPLAGGGHGWFLQGRFA